MSDCVIGKDISEGFSIEEALKRLNETRQKNIEEFGYFAEFVVGGDTVNYHTHGVLENFDHPDFQIVLNIDPKTANWIFHDMVEKIKSGDRFEPGKVYSGILGNGYNIAVTPAMESNRDVLRVILPDDSGSLESSEKDYALQLENLGF